MKTFFKIVLVLCSIFLIIALAMAFTNGKINSNKESSFMRLVKVEEYPSLGITIFYDQLTNVMYMSGHKSGITPIYNDDGTLYLEGTPMTVG